MIVRGTKDNRAGAVEGRGPVEGRVVTLPARIVGYAGITRACLRIILRGVANTVNFEDSGRRSAHGEGGFGLNDSPTPVPIVVERMDPDVLNGERNNGRIRTATDCERMSGSILQTQSEKPVNCE